jgi:GNAT superfamily N-acetyltransferase
MANAPPWVIERLSDRHDRTAFDCGVRVLNDWLKQRAGQFARRDLARTYVAVRPPEPAVLGYYAVSSHTIRYEALPADRAKGLPRLDLPVVLLGRLGVDQSTQGQGLGADLLIDALRRVQQLADEIGIAAVEVDAIDDAAKRFYEKHGFVALRDDARHLFLPMGTIRALKLAPLGT